MDKFENPYDNVPKEDKIRTTIDISAKDKAKMSAVHPKVGTLQTTLNLLFVKLINELDKHGINCYNPELYERAVAGATLNLAVPAGRAQQPVNAQAPAGNDGRRTLSVAREASGPRSEPSTTPGTPTRSRKSGKR